MATRTLILSNQFTDMDDVSIVTAGSIAVNTLTVLYENGTSTGALMAMLENAKQAILKDVAG